jgi:hypothetical protein
VARRSSLDLQQVREEMERQLTEASERADREQLRVRAQCLQHALARAQRSSVLRALRTWGCLLDRLRAVEIGHKLAELARQRALHRALLRRWGQWRLFVAVCEQRLIAMAGMAQQLSELSQVTAEVDHLRLVVDNAGDAADAADAGQQTAAQDGEYDEEYDEDEDEDEDEDDADEDDDEDDPRLVQLGLAWLSWGELVGSAQRLEVGLGAVDLVLRRTNLRVLLIAFQVLRQAWRGERGGRGGRGLLAAAPVSAAVALALQSTPLVTQEPLVDTTQQMTQEGAQSSAQQVFDTQGVPSAGPSVPRPLALVIGDYEASDVHVAASRGFRMVSEMHALEHLERRIGWHHTAVGFQTWRAFVGQIALLHSLNEQIAQEHHREEESPPQKALGN